MLLPPSLTLIYMNYFVGCKNEQEYKAKYKELAKMHHPDVGGDERVMQEINNQFDGIEKHGFPDYAKVEVDREAIKQSYHYNAFNRAYRSAMYQDINWGNHFEDIKKQFAQQRTIRKQNEKARLKEKLLQEYSTWSHSSLVQLVVEMKLETSGY